jgi:ThiF family
MRPVLKQSLRRVWRDETTLQIGVDPERAVVLGGIGRAAARFVDGLDGTKDRDEVVAAAPKIGLDESTAARLLNLLLEGGVLDDAAADTRALYELTGDERDRIRPDLASLSLVHGAPGAGIAAFTRRRQASVHVFGAGRVGAPLAAMLGAAGVGHVLVSDTQPARLADVAPGGLSLWDVGARRQDGARAAVTRAAGDVRSRLPSARNVPDLAVLAPVGRFEASQADRLVRSGVPHLVAAVRESTGLVGPLVLPGRSSCLRCHDHYRCDRDPAWPRVAAQLAAVDGTATPACDTVLALAVATQAALHALMFLDGERPPSVDGTVEIHLPDGHLRRRSWPSHYACGCSWANEEMS